MPMNEVVREVPIYTPTNELTVATLTKEVVQELRDELYANRTHGKPATYRLGCRGHLCKYAQRTRQRGRRSLAVRQALPSGVVPETRTRAEQSWDEVIMRFIKHLHSTSIEEQIKTLEQRRVS